MASLTAREPPVYLRSPQGAHGHSDAPTVSGGYGAKNMLLRWGANVLKEAIEKITYPGLDLSRVRPPGQSRQNPKAIQPANLKQSKN
jgi:hypothetical protein